MTEKKSGIAEAIEKVITEMMDRVMVRITEERPFIPEKHHSQKPLYAALVPDTIFRGSHFERTFSTKFGKVWEQLGHIVGLESRGKAILDYSIEGTVKEGRLIRIREVLNKLEHKGKQKNRAKPNWKEEIGYIMKGGGDPIPVTVISDLYIEDVKTSESMAIELKAPLPNSDQSKVSKEKIFKLYAMEEKPVNEAFFALPYNPYGKREDYAWSFPKRWFDMVSSPVVLMGDEFWDKVGGDGTYESFINIVTELGKDYHEQIYKEYLGMELPENYQYFSLKK